MDEIAKALLENGSLILRDARLTPGEKHPEGEPYVARVTGWHLDATAWGPTPHQALVELARRVRDEMQEQIQKDAHRREAIVKGMRG